MTAPARILAAALLAVGWAAAPRAWAAGPPLPGQVVRLKPHPVGLGPNITLGDLVADALPPEAAAEVVQAADGPGIEVGIDTDLVAMKLKVAPGGPWTLRPGYPPQLTVPVPKQVVTAKALAAFARGALDRALASAQGVTVTTQGKVFPLTLYASPVRLRARLPQYQDLRGYVEVGVDVLQSQGGDREKVVATVPVSFLVQARGPRLFTTVPVDPGDALGPQNLEARVVDETFLPDGFASLEQVRGRVARTYIPAGRPLDARAVDLPWAIHRGDEVRLIVRSGGVEVQTRASALQPAHVGDTLQLRVEPSGQQVQARCVDGDVAVENAW